MCHSKIDPPPIPIESPNAVSKKNSNRRCRVYSSICVSTSQRYYSLTTVLCIMYPHMHTHSTHSTRDKTQDTTSKIQRSSASFQIPHTNTHRNIMYTQHAPDISNTRLPTFRPSALRPQAHTHTHNPYQLPARLHTHTQQNRNAIQPHGRVRHLLALSLERGEEENARIHRMCGAHTTAECMLCAYCMAYYLRAYVVCAARARARALLMLFPGFHNLYRILLERSRARKRRARRECVCMCLRGSAHLILHTRVARVHARNVVCGPQVHSEIMCMCARRAFLCGPRRSDMI